MSNYEVVHHFFNKDDREIMGKTNDLVGYVVDDLLSQHERRGTLRTTRKKYIHQKEL